ncbi:MAG: dihydroorotase, partial [Bacteroidales bacterium]|nr:dihydroorotase [Bacteroidales bacterium]
MPGNHYIYNAKIVNEGEVFQGGVIIRDGLIRKIIRQDDPLDAQEVRGMPALDAGGKFLIPGVIDDQVHFREPGLTHKGDIYTESRAAVAGGVTSFMEMPNTQP